MLEISRFYRVMYFSVTVKLSLYKKYGYHSCAVPLNPHVVLFTPDIIKILD